LHAVPAVELDAFAGYVAQAGEYGRRRVEQGVGRAARQFRQCRAWTPAAVGAPSEEAVDFEAYREAVSGRSW
jgi:hypothetical protein